jgi:hypothetical protein
MEQYSLGHVSTRSWVVSFKVALGKSSVRNEAFRFCSLGTARCSKPRHLTNVSCGRRVRLGVFPETAADCAHSHAVMRKCRVEYMNIDEVKALDVALVHASETGLALDSPLWIDINGRTW